MAPGNTDVRSAYAPPSGAVDTLRTVQRVVAEVLAEAGEPRSEPVEPGSRLTDHAVSSIRLLQVHARLEEALGLEIPAPALFDHETVAALAEYLASRR